MIITGRIFDILVHSEKYAQIVLRKKVNGKIVPVAIQVFGYWKDKALKEQKLKMKDKIKGNIYMRSKLYNGKYYTDVYFKDIILVEESVDIKNTLFREQPQEMPEAIIEDGDFVIDTSTGEIIEG